MEMEIQEPLQLIDFKLEENLKIRLPNWPKGDFVRYKKVGPSNYILSYWQSAKMKLINDFQLSAEDLMSDKWVRIE